MDIKTIDKIVKWIPFKELRYNIKELLYSYYNLYENLKDIREYHFIKHVSIYEYDRIIEFRKSVKNDKDFYKKYFEFTKNLDDSSLELVSNIISKILNYNNIDDPIYFRWDELKKFNKMSYNYYSNIIKINDDCYAYKNYFLPFNLFEDSVFYQKCSINELNTSIFADKDIIDAGAFIGDTAIVLSDYTNKNVYSFEPFSKNFKTMLKTIELNKKNNIVPINAALGDTNKDILIYSNGEINVGGSLETTNNHENFIEEKVSMVTLDSYVKEYNLNVGLIKTDLEGFEQKFLEGAINTIIEQKPSLMISIYHNYNDFFEIKPMLEKLGLGYKFKINKAINAGVLLETKLIAECY